MFNRTGATKVLRPSRLTMWSTLLSSHRSPASQTFSEVPEPKSPQSEAWSLNSSNIQNIERPVSPTPAFHPTYASRPTLSLDTHLHIYNPGKHVIVKFRHDSAPTLDLRRFSDLVIPLPTAPSNSSEKNSARVTTASSQPTVSAHSPTSPRSHVGSLRTFSLPPAKRERTPLSMTPPTATRGRLLDRTTEMSDEADKSPSEPSRTTLSRQSQKSFASITADSLVGVRAIACEFPGVPPHWQDIVIRRAGAISTGDGADVRPTGGHRSTSIDSGLVRQGSSIKRKPVPEFEDVEQQTSDLTHEPNQSGALQDLITPNTTLAFASPPPSRQPSRRSRSRSQARPSRSLSPRSNRSSRISENPWMPGHRDIMKESRAELDLAWRQLGKLRERESIKSVGSISAKRCTPTPSYNSSSHRGSLMPEWHSMLDGNIDGNIEEDKPDGSHPPRATSSMASIISDSPTLGM